MDRPVVLVEDDPDVTALADLTIDGLQCYGDGHSMVQALEGGLVPRLVILDLDLPGMDGLMVLDAIRQRPSTRRVPVVIFSGKDVSTEEGYRRGANAWVRKPKDADRLEAALQSIAAFWCGLNQAPEP